MISQSNSGEIFIEETERKPNKYAANVLFGVVFVIFVVCMLNEIGVFEINRLLVRICFFVALLQFVILQIIVRVNSFISKKGTKYIVMCIILFLVLTVTTLLNIHAILAFVIPILLAVQYRSRLYSAFALVGSIACCAAAPILSYNFNTWNLNFMKGYLETFCKVTISVENMTDIARAEALDMIMLYWALPQMLTLLAFGLFLFSATRSGIDNVRRQMKIMDLSNDLNMQLASIITMQEKTLCSMSDIIESRDIETGGHVRRTSRIVQMLMSSMAGDAERGITGAFYRDVIRSAPMHDLGKIAIPDAILRKPGKLTEDEFTTVRMHPIRSAEIIERVLTGIENNALLKTAKNIALYHHECYDGNGYPYGLKGEKIPLEARVMAIADVYDALVSERCYKAPMHLDEAFEVVESLMGTKFDPALNKYFLECREDIEAFYAGH